jgi:hypothetical protein
MRARILISSIVIILAIAFFSMSYAQDTVSYRSPKKKSDLLQRMSFGGYLGAQFGTVTMIDVSPIVGYDLTEKFQLGVGGTFQYYRYKDPNYSAYQYKSTAYGANLYGRYFIWNELFAHVEYAPLYVNYYDFFDDGSGNPIMTQDATWVHDFLVGGGYRQWIGNTAFITIMMLWNVNESYYSPYRNPIIKIGVGAGI